MHNAIEFHGLVKKYGKFELGPLNLNVPKGAIYGLIGPNGAGKTTLIDLIFGMGCNDGGRIEVLGLDHRADEVALKQVAAYASPELNFQAWGRIGKAIRFVRGFYPEWDDGYCGELMKAFHLGDSDRIATLSFGKTKLSLLVALARRPQVLILDEPTTGLDAISRQQVFRELLQFVKDGDRTVLISSHNLADIERFSDHLGLLKNGRLLLEGRTDEVVARHRFAEFYTGESASFDKPLPEGIRVLKWNENRLRVLLDIRSGAQAWLEQNGARDITTTPLTLDDLFVALFQEEAAE